MSTDPTIVACGTSVMWSTGNAYENKFPNLVHEDLTGSYPIDEKYLHYNDGSGSPSGSGNPTPSYYEKTTNDNYGSGHPNGDPIPPKQYRARGGAIMGLSKPAPVLFGNKDLSDMDRNDDKDWLTRNADGDYYGKLDYWDHSEDGYASKFSKTDINKSRWLVARDIGWGWPTIPHQIEQFPKTQRYKEVDVPDGNYSLFGGQPDDQPPAGTEVDVALVDGGTNDLTLGWLNNPLESGRPTIWKAVRQYMYRDMTGQNGLLARARSRFPNAVIVLLGYPVWASNRTNNRRAKKFLVEKKAEASILPKVVEQAYDNAVNFSHFQAYWLRRAVAEANRTDPGPGIVMAPPGWGMVNSMMADWPWSFGFDPRGSNPGITNDDVKDIRETICGEEYDAEHECVGDICLDRRAEIKPVSCRAAPIGHPNNEGCRQYADTIVRRYKTYIDRSVREFTDGLDPDEESVRESIDRYGLDHERDGVRYTTTHDVIDGMRVRPDTNSGNGRANGEIYLTVYPGRNGSGERFRLDTENNDTKPDGPDSRPEDEFHVDPMMRRRMDGWPGNLDQGETGIKGLDETTVQTYKSGNHWSDRRLELGDVRYATLQLQGVDPGGGWSLDHIDLSINGHLKRQRNFATFDAKDTRVTDKNTVPHDRREFLLATFNDVEGVTASDLSVRIPPGSLSFNPSSSEVAIGLDVEITNNSNHRLPDVGVQYGMRVKDLGGTFTGRDWRVDSTGAIPAGGTGRLDVELATNDAVNLRTNNDIDLVAIAEVAGSFNKTKRRTRKKDIQS